MWMAIRYYLVLHPCNTMCRVFESICSLVTHHASHLLAHYYRWGWWSRVTGLSWPGGQATSRSYGNVLSKFSINHCLFYYQPFQHQPSGCQPLQHQNSDNRPHPSCIDTNTIPTVLTCHRWSTQVPPLVLPDQVASSENIHILRHLAMKQTPYEMPNHTYSEVCPCIYLDVPIP